ncbi:hypothetical protein L6303_03200 [archaeon]|nr:hypothetical protein [Nanoarchaeota archaeon]MBU4299585.1 hypothetical protein [Nanoarchaeota archaeon]MCG2723724.1 hypothetical protein [archaeon]
MNDLDAATIEYRKILAEKDVYNKINEHYPGAIPSKDFVPKILDLLKDNGLEPENAFVGSITCRDEVERKMRNYVNNAPFAAVFDLAVYGGNATYFNIKSLAPYKHHFEEPYYPCFILNVHTTMNKNGVLGKVERPTIENISLGCGALLGLLSKWHGGKFNPDHHWEFKSMEDTLSNYKDAILSLKNPELEIKAITDKLYDLSMHHLTTTVKNGVVFGAVDINTDPGFEDMSHFRDAVLIKTYEGTKSEIDLMNL